MPAAVALRSDWDAKRVRVAAREAKDADQARRLLAIAVPRSFVGRTATGAAIDFAVQQLQASPAESERRVIDVSGDDTSNAGRPVIEARDAAVAAGITINGLAIINKSSGPAPAYASHTNPPGGLSKYYRETYSAVPVRF